MMMEFNILYLREGDNTNEQVKIDPEFQSLIPSLSEDEYRQLEENCKRDGILDSLKVWNGFLIDGHNRFKISEEWDLNYTVEEMDFPDRTSVIRWIITNQFGRRNLSAYDRSVLALKLKPIMQAEAKKRQVRKPTNFVSQNSVEQKSMDTQKELAKSANVSHDTIHKVEVIETKGSDVIKQAVRSGEISINKAYLAVTSPSRSPAQIKKEEQQEVRDRREDFQTKKESGIVSFSDIRQEQEDRKEEAEMLWRRCIVMGKTIDDVKTDCEAGEVNFGEMMRNISEDSKSMLIRALCRWSVILEQFIKEAKD